ncbi:MOS1T transposase, partial [Pseudoatta argentina]
MQMEVLLIKNDAWEYVNGDLPKPELKPEDQATEAAHRTWIRCDSKAKLDIILSTSPSELKQIKELETSREVWLKLECICASKGPARKAILLKQLMRQLMGRIHRIRPEYRDPEDWSLLHDNAPSHTSLIVRHCLARNRVSVLNHPPYSPDLAPCAFSLFPKLKLKLKGRFFDDIPTIQSASTQALEAIPQTELEHAFESLLNRCNKCIEARGEDFE